ncbi:MAG: arginine--tRNA ligase [Archaeoglobaceae archaeon]|nr:arginine--tRNA ligase [Archaeoglobaceae archaeon]MCX8152213.1 arginine--tRNA ligase [Archaeoglobaceae archaeon]MDW8013999.1 arginine--tRNA ligase [Archaeoglobaceae archaeon]
MFLKLIEDVKKILKDFGDERYIRESEHADLCSTIAFKIAKDTGKDAKIVADEIVEGLTPLGYVSSVHSINGYINFFANEEFLEDTVKSILKDQENYGKLNFKGKVLVEHTSANPDGPLHIGHVRNAVLGDCIARILKKAGYDVLTHYYINDMGRQMAVTYLGYELFGFSDKKSDHAVADSYIKANVELEKRPELEKRVEEIMLKYESLNEEVFEKMRNIVSFALEGIKQTLERLNVWHDEFVWESDFVKNGSVQEILKKLDEKKIVEKDGAWIVRLEGFEKEVILKRENGTTLYIARDLAYHSWKSKFFDRIVNVLGADHKLHASQLLKLLEIIEVKKPEVVFFEFVSLPEGRMSTRKGRYVSADELMEKVKEEALKLLESRDISQKEKDEIAEAVAIGAIRFDFVKVAPEKHITFDWHQALDFERQTASYIQYTHARACSILRKALEYGMQELDFKGDLCNKEERKLVINLSKFPYQLMRAAKDLRPHYIAEYLLSLSSNFNEFYRLHPVLKCEKELRMHRLALVDATRIVLKNGLELLGIKPLEKM